MVPPEPAKPHRFDVSPEIYKHWAELAAFSCGFKFPCWSGMRGAHSHPHSRNHETTSIATKAAALGCCSPQGSKIPPEWDPTTVTCQGRQPAAGTVEGLLYVMFLAFGFIFLSPSADNSLTITNNNNNNKNPSLPPKWSFFTGEPRIGSSGIKQSLGHKFPNETARLSNSARAAKSSHWYLHRLRVLCWPFCIQQTCQLFDSKLSSYSRNPDAAFGMIPAQIIFKSPLCT